LSDKQKAESCAAKGLEYVEKALATDPEYVDAMFYKSLLYREQQMLTKDEAKRKDLDGKAKKISDQASALQQKREAEAKAKEAQSKPQG
jgi:tRNA G18 (ribose-2'-O)-methylase SpoU